MPAIANVRKTQLPESTSSIDVTVIGGGLAGMAASFHLAKAGLRVLCIEPETDFSKVVGESLDWSSPELLRTLGLPMERLIDERVATYKRHVIVKLVDGGDRHYIPSEWLSRPPFNVQLKTLHVDRQRLGEALRGIVLGQGVQLLHDKVTAIEREGKRVLAVATAQGARIASPWFIDASGAAASLFPRLFNLPFRDYGPRKVAFWTYFDVSELTEGTTLYACGPQPHYMEWVWEIPIRPGVISVGYVAPADVIKTRRREGLSVEEIFREELRRFPRFDTLLQHAGELAPLTTSFQCRVHKNVAGPNWLVAGEAASTVDPMTSNGVTAALRHAEEAAGVILLARNRRRLPRLASALYSRRVFDLGRFFNSGIEKVVYDLPVRNRIGILDAGDVYTVPAWSLNNVYSRFRTRGIVATFFVGFLLNVIRTGGELYYSFCRRMQSSPEAAG